MKLSELIRQETFSSPGSEAILNIMVTHSWLHGELASAMAPFGVTPAQYNVLRILKGSHPSRMTCSDIGVRLLDRTPDVTRLLNRLEKAKLITRVRSRKDRRVVQVGVSPTGLELLASMEPAVEALQDRLMQHVAADEVSTLSSLLERIRTDQVV